MRRLETVRTQEEGWQEPCESGGSRTDLWERGGEIPLRYPTQHSADIWFSRKISQTLNKQQVGVFVDCRCPQNRVSALALKMPYFNSNNYWLLEVEWFIL